MANSLRNLVSATERTTARQRVVVQARLTWKDQTGSIRFASGTTRDLSDGGAFVECTAASPLPLFRLVHVQLETTPKETAGALGSGRVLAAVWRVERNDAPGAAQGYALRFLIDPAQRGAQHTAPGFTSVPKMVAAC